MDPDPSAAFKRGPAVALFLLFFLLNVFDALVTIEMTSRGAVELNPFMALMLERGPTAFFFIKMLLAVGSMGLIYAAGLKVPSVRRFCWSTVKLLTAVYALVAVWHILIMTVLAPN